MFCYREPLEPLFKLQIQTEWETYFKKDSNVLLENINAETVTSSAILVACATQNKNHSRRDLDHLKHTN